MPHGDRPLPTQAPSFGSLKHPFGSKGLFKNGYSLFTRRASPPARWRPFAFCAWAAGLLVVEGKGNKTLRSNRPAGWPTQLPGRLIKTPLQLKWPANLPTAGFGPPSGLRSPCPDSGAARDRAGRHYFFRFVLGPSPTTGWPDPPGAWARLNSQQGSQKPEPGR